MPHCGKRGPGWQAAPRLRIYEVRRKGRSGSVAAMRQGREHGQARTSTDGKSTFRVRPWLARVCPCKSSVPRMRLAERLGQLFRRVAARGGAGGSHHKALSLEPQPGGFHFAPHQHQRAASEVLAQEILEDRGAAQRLHGHRPPLPHLHGPEHSQTGGRLQDRRDRMRRAAPLQPAGPQAQGPGGLDQRREPFGRIFDPEQMGELHGVLPEGPSNRGEGSPKKDEASPQMDEGSPEKDGPSPKRDEGSPKKAEAPPKTDEGSPEKDGPPPKKDEGSPQKAQASPKMDESSPEKDEAFPKKDGRFPRFTPPPLDRARSPGALAGRLPHPASRSPSNPPAPPRSRSPSGSRRRRSGDRSPGGPRRTRRGPRARRNRPARDGGPP